MPGGVGRLIDWDTVSAMVGKCRRTITRWEKDGRFPKHVTLGPQSVAWIESEVLAWLNHRIEERRAA